MSLERVIHCLGGFHMYSLSLEAAKPTLFIILFYCEKKMNTFIGLDDFFSD